MELDQFKELWQQDLPGKGHDLEILKSLLDKKSSSPVAKMKRNLNIELWVILLSYGSMILFYFIAFDGRMSEISWFMLFIGGLFILYYLRKLKLLREMECLACQVKSNLEKQIQSLEKYIRFYLIAGTALVPFSVLFFWWLFRMKLRHIPDQSIFYTNPLNPWWKAALAWVLLTAGLTFLLFHLNRWYVRKLYGRHVDKLKSVLREMEGED
jgi:4-hydroxybenzoate polyprenyltransferase